MLFMIEKKVWKIYGKKCKSTGMLPEGMGADTVLKAEYDIELFFVLKTG